MSGSLIEGVHGLLFFTKGSRVASAISYTVMSGLFIAEGTTQFLAKASEDVKFFSPVAGVVVGLLAKAAGEVFKSSSLGGRSEAAWRAFTAPQPETPGNKKPRIRSARDLNA